MKIPTRKLLYTSNSVLLERRLKYKGQLLPKKGEKVNIFDVLGKGYKIDQLIELPLDVAGHLNVGDKLKSGDVIGGSKFLKAIGQDKGVKINFDGVVYFKDKEKVVVGSFVTESQLISGVYGKVIDVIEGKSLLINASGLVMQGVEGYGESVFGELKTIVSISTINPKLKGKVIVYSEKVTRETLDKLISEGVIGIIVGGLTQEDYWYLIEKEMPFVMVHGFGDIAIDTALVLETSDLQNRFAYLRPGVSQVLISENIVKPSELHDFAEVKVGGAVISVAPKSFGSYGKIEEILEGGKLRVNFFDDKTKEDLMYYDFVSPLISI
jgi:hypothetical protein